jgi:hypothetical protein
LTNRDKLTYYEDIKIIKMQIAESEEMSMSVWGIGAYFPGEREDIAKQCIMGETIIIGYSEQEKPKLYEKLRSVKAGDLVFIKSRFMPTKPLRVKAVGIALGSKVSIENGMDGKQGIKIHWIEDFTNAPRIIQKGQEYDGDNQTIYQEMNEDVIRQIVEFL